MIHRLIQIVFVISLLISTEVKSAGTEVDAELPVLQWCLDNYPARHNYPATGQPFGPTVDFMQELAKRSGFKLAFSQNTPFARCLKLMEAGRTDLMVRLNYSAEREKYMHLIPYMRTIRSEHLYILQQQKDIADITELDRLIVGIIRDYIYNAPQLNLLKKNHKKIVEIESEETAMAMLLYRRIDVVIAPKQTIDQLIESSPKYQGVIKAASLSFSSGDNNHIHIGLSHKSPQAHFIQQLKTAVAQMRQDGVLQQYYQLELEQQRKAVTEVQANLSKHSQQH